MSKRRLRLPGEYIRRSLVTVEMDSLEAEVFVPEKLEAALKRRRDNDVVVVEEHYIVSTRRIDERWTFTVEHAGEVTILPDAVIDRILAQREAIITEGRKDRGRIQAAARLAQRAKEDQEAAELAALEG